MDKALKQRLVGASVLIALAVIVLPMLLGGPTETGQLQSQQIELPSIPEGMSFETRRFPLADGAAGSPGRTAASQQTPNEALPTEHGAGSPVAQNTSSGGNEALVEAAAESANAGQNIEGQPPVTAVEVPVSEKVDLPVEATLPETQDIQMASAGRYAVQVASLSSEANAKRLQSDLESRGYPVIADRIDSDVGRLHRVKVGPFDSEAAANAAGKKIQSQLEGVSPRTVDLHPAAATQVVNPSDPLVRWVVQLGSFAETTNADNLVKQVRAQGMSAYSERITSSSGAAVSRVRVGPFLQREDAAKVQQSLKSSLKINGVVMSAE